MCVEEPVFAKLGRITLLLFPLCHRPKKKAIVDCAQNQVKLNCEVNNPIKMSAGGGAGSFDLATSQKINCYLIDESIFEKKVS